MRPSTPRPADPTHCPPSVEHERLSSAVDRRSRPTQRAPEVPVHHPAPRWCPSRNATSLRTSTRCFTELATKLLEYPYTERSRPAAGTKRTSTEPDNVEVATGDSTTHRRNIDLGEEVDAAGVALSIHRVDHRIAAISSHHTRIGLAVPLPVMHRILRLTPTIRLGRRRHRHTRHQRPHRRPTRLRHHRHRHIRRLRQTEIRTDRLVATITIRCEPTIRPRVPRHHHRLTRRGVNRHRHLHDLGQAWPKESSSSTKSTRSSCSPSSTWVVSQSKRHFPSRTSTRCFTELATKLLEYPSTEDHHVRQPARARPRPSPTTSKSRGDSTTRTSATSTSVRKSTVPVSPWASTLGDNGAITAISSTTPASVLPSHSQ